MTPDPEILQSTTETFPLDHHNARILIVDDEPANLKLLTKLLQIEGFTNLVAIQDAREVLATYQTQSPDLILLDLQMPHLNGFEVIRQLKGLGDVLLPPIVVITAQHSHDNLLHALAVGARDFLSKPFDRYELMVRVRNLLDAHLAHRLVRDQKEVLEGLVRQRTDALQRTRLQVVQRLSRAAEYRDNETGQHIVRMSHMAALLAEQLGWDPGHVELMLHASPMHDIGKIGIPDHILLKPGKLDEAEWVIMRGHCAIGAGILEGDESDLLGMARDIARYHHEKWDGGGYPEGLAGEVIPAAARIVAVSDVFDALTSERPYKRAWPVEESTDYVRAQSGLHFEPRVVEAFLDNLPQVLDIRERYAEHGG